MESFAYWWSFIGYSAGASVQFVHSTTKQSSISSSPGSSLARGLWLRVTRIIDSLYSRFVAEINIFRRQFVRLEIWTALNLLKKRHRRDIAIWIWVHAWVIWSPPPRCCSHIPYPRKDTVDRCFTRNRKSHLLFENLCFRFQICILTPSRLWVTMHAAYAWVIAPIIARIQTSKFIDSPQVSKHSHSTRKRSQLPIIPAQSLKIWSFTKVGAVNISMRNVAVVSPLSYVDSWKAHSGEFIDWWWSWLPISTLIYQWWAQLIPCNGRSDYVSRS